MADLPRTEAGQVALPPTAAEMGQQAVREQLVEALEMHVMAHAHTAGCHGKWNIADCSKRCRLTIRALARHYAEPECPDAIPIDDVREAVEPPHRWG